MECFHVFSPVQFAGPVEITDDVTVLAQIDETSYISDMVILAPCFVHAPFDVPHRMYC